MPNPVVHYEIMGRDTQRTVAFYHDVFGWDIDADNPMNYGLVLNDTDHGISGAVGGGGEPRVTVYVEVDDPAAYLRRVVEAGGTVAMDVTVVPGAVTMAQFRDLDGNLVGVVGREVPPAEG